MENPDWKSTASPENLRRRASLLATLRRFFAGREVMEVETPLLGQRTVTDVHLQSFAVANGGEEWFLQTSPECAMKRLLAGGCGAIYQIGKAFRQQEQGRQHNPEFTLLEWYRTDFSLDQLMQEVEALVRQLLGCPAIPRLSYAELFATHCHFNPHTIAEAELEAMVRERLSPDVRSLTGTDCLQLLMSQVIEPQLPSQCFVCDYPVAQAAMAATRKNAQGLLVADRFELYCGGMELANGYRELTDATEQAVRFARELAQRKALGLPAVPQDERLLGALRAGLPDCAGVALGVDRLLMVLSNSDSIEEVLSFPFQNA